MAQTVGAVVDGAAWIQGFLDLHGPTAVRTLDFPHASQRFQPISDLVVGVGSTEGAAWQLDHRQHLKQVGAAGVLPGIHALHQAHATVPGLAEHVGYLASRMDQMDYPAFQAAGWPIGSGMVESANKLVVEARLKGSGMHWSVANVDGMLALRNAIGNDRWDEVWAAISDERRAADRQARFERQQQRRQQQHGR